LLRVENEKYYQLNSREVFQRHVGHTEQRTEIPENIMRVNRVNNLQSLVACCP